MAWNLVHFLFVAFLFNKDELKFNGLNLNKLLFCDWYHLDKDSHEHNNICSWKGKTDDLVILNNGLNCTLCCIVMSCCCMENDHAKYQTTFDIYRHNKMSLGLVWKMLYPLNAWINYIHWRYNPLLRAINLVKLILYFIPGKSNLK